MFDPKTAPEWGEAQRQRPAEIFFLNPDYLRRAGRAAFLCDEVIEASVRCAARVAARKAWPPSPGTATGGCIAPSWRVGRRSGTGRNVTAELGDDAGRFYIVVLLSGTTLMQEEHRKHAIPADVVRDTLLDVTLWLDFEQRSSGEAIPGFRAGNIAWLCNHFRARLYRLGRLQFQLAPSSYPIRAFRHRESRAVLLLSEDGVRYRPDGSRGIGESETDWVARLVVRDDTVTGNPILPTGAARPTAVRLSRVEWEQVLAPGDPALHLHIPGDGPMTLASCQESFRRAMEFFPRHYPEYRFRAFLCGSWILNTWLAEVLPPEANMVQLQREVYLFPIPMRAEDTYWRIFGERFLPDDLSQLPRASRLQRALAEALESGRGMPIGGGGCLLLAEDLGRGPEVYRRQRMPIALP